MQNMLIIQEYKQSVEFMQQSAFLSKLYEIKPFKIVESPQTLKTCPDIQLRMPEPAIHQLQHLKSIQSCSLQQKCQSRQSSSIPSIVNSNFLKIQSFNSSILSTPNKKNHQDIQVRNSSKKIIRRGSNQQTFSPVVINLIKKPQSSASKVNGQKISPMKTPNKQNYLNTGPLIQSHLYTNLSSSIDNLFSKIEKIKQQFDCTLNNSNKKNELSNQNDKNRSLQQNKQIPLQLGKEFGYSPILRPSASIQQSSLSSLSPLLKATNPLPQSTPTYQTNLQKMQKMYENPQNTKKQSQQIEPFILPATHNNITEINNRTKSIIDQINLLLDSSKKNYQGKQEKKQVKFAPRMRKLVKYHTCYEGDALMHGQDVNKAPMLPQDFDEFDEEFTMIKLKTTQSQNPQKQPQSNSLPTKKQNPSKTNSKQSQTSLYNLNYKLDQPIYSEQNKSPIKTLADQKICLSTSYCQNQTQIVKNNNNTFTCADTSAKNSVNIQSGLSMREFQLGKCVGSGKFGDVHICKHKPTGFIFALKKIFKSTIIEYNMIDQFTQQLRIHYSLSNHPHITKLYTHFTDEYHIFLLLEYIPDGTLLPFQPMPEPALSPLTSQLLTTIEYLHRNSIVHRDIKPQNILLSYGVIKLCDFGWSSRCQNQMRKTFCGTLDYVSPQMKDKGVYNQSVDLWSVGVLVFEMLAGFPPYKKEIEKWRGMGAKIRQKWNWDVLYPPQISDCAKRFIQKLLKQDPDERISIRECKQQQFITKYNRKQFNSLYQSEFQRILS